MPDTLQPIVLETADAAETADLGARLAKGLRPGDVIALIGPLGAGKTQFVRGVAGGLGADTRQVASPTFVLMTEYPAPTPIVHIDAYRMQEIGELESTGFTESIARQSITLIEWADRLGAQIPADHLQVTIDHAPAGRRLTIQPQGQFADRLAELTRLMTAGDAGKHAQTARCSVCKAPLVADSPTYPFCSQRCRLVDLNRWFNGQYSLSRPITNEDEPEAS